MEVRCAATEELEERVGTQVGVNDEKNSDEIFCTGFKAKTMKTMMIPNNINPLNRNRKNFILISDRDYTNIISLPFVSLPSIR